MNLRHFLAVGALALSAACATTEGVVSPDDPDAVVSTTDVSGWFRPLPFHRILDIQQATLFYPDTIGICLQTDPVWFLGLEGCLAGIFVITTVHLDLRLPVFHFLQLSDDLLQDGSHKIHGWELGIGPMGGIREVFIVGIVGSSDTFTGADTGLSAEAVYWFTKRIGLKMQLDAGAIVGSAGRPPTTIPFVESKIGVAF